MLTNWEKYKTNSSTQKGKIEAPKMQNEKTRELGLQIKEESKSYKIKLSI